MNPASRHRVLASKPLSTDRNGDNAGRQAPELRGIDRNDPAYPRIVQAICSMLDAGVELTPEAVQIAVLLAKRSHSNDPRSKEERRHRPPVKPGHVYYILRGGLIKIGTTTDLRGRMQALLPEAVLAIEPGGQPLEKQRHRQFVDSKVTGQREWFHPSPELAAHIMAVVSAHGEPPDGLPTLSAAA